MPFDVPAGTTRLTFAYEYDRAGRRQRRRPRACSSRDPLELGSPAYRGWSGGERKTVTITGTEATPGYWPGPLPAGRWNVVLGLYKVADAGVDVEVTIETAAAGAAPAPPITLPARPAEPLRRGARWYSGGLHMHTVHSDGTLTVREISARAREAGLDFIAITDHNNTTHQMEAAPDDGLLRIVGEEMTTPGGHASVWGLGGVRDYVDFRVLPGDPRIADLVRAVTSRGALFSINHPGAACAGCGWEHAVPEGVTGIEITNGNHGEMARAIALWDDLLKQGRRIVGVGSSDWHRGPRTHRRGQRPRLGHRALHGGHPRRDPARTRGRHGRRPHAAAAARGPGRAAIARERGRPCRWAATGRCGWTSPCRWRSSAGAWT